MSQELAKCGTNKTKWTRRFPSRSGGHKGAYSYEISQTASSSSAEPLNRDSPVQIGRALGLTCVMATPEIASSPPTISFGVMRSPRNNTLEIKANTGSSRPKGATWPIEQRAISQNQRPNPTIPPNKNCVGEAHPTFFTRRNKARLLPILKEQQHQHDLRHSKQ